MVKLSLNMLARNIQSHESPFPLGTTSKEVFEHVQVFVNAAGAKMVPCALAADDTKLTESLHPYRDPKNKKFYVVGVAGHPIEVAEPEELEQILCKGKHELASKVRIWFF